MTAPASIATSTRRAAVGGSPVSLAEIYEDEVNIAVWQRELANELCEAANRVIEARPGLQVSISVSSGKVRETLIDAFGGSSLALALANDIAELADMFSCLFDLERIGLRLGVLERAMCPRFHVDNVPCRLVTTYAGSGTEWLPHSCVQRSKLGPGSKGVPDEFSGLYSSVADIRQLQAGHVALLKGEAWEGNEDTGLVHRSPKVEGNTRRLLLTMDMTNQ